MKKYILIALMAVGLAASAQQTPTIRKRSDATFTQVDEYLNVSKRLGIPTSDTDNLDANFLPQNSRKLIFNTTLSRFRIYNPASGTWSDATAGDLSNYLPLTGGDLSGYLNVAGGVSNGYRIGSTFQLYTDGTGTAGDNVYFKNGVGGNLNFQGYNFNYSGVNANFSSNLNVDGGLTLTQGLRTGQSITVGGDVAGGYGYFNRLVLDGTGEPGTGGNLSVVSNPGKNNILYNAQDLHVFSLNGTSAFYIGNTDITRAVDNKKALFEGDALPLNGGEVTGDITTTGNILVNEVGGGSGYSTGITAGLVYAKQNDKQINIESDKINIIDASDGSNVVIRKSNVASNINIDWPSTSGKIALESPSGMGYVQLSPTSDQSGNISITGEITAGGNAYLSGSTTNISGNAIIGGNVNLSGDLIVSNDRFYKGKKSDGTVGYTMGISSNDNIYFGDIIDNIRTSVIMTGSNQSIVLDSIGMSLNSANIHLPSLPTLTENDYSLLTYQNGKVKKAPSLPFFKVEDAAGYFQLNSTGSTMFNNTTGNYWSQAPDFSVNVINGKPFYIRFPESPTAGATYRWPVDGGTVLTEEKAATTYASNGGTIVNKFDQTAYYNAQSNADVNVRGIYALDGIMVRPSGVSNTDARATYLNQDVFSLGGGYIAINNGTSSYLQRFYNANDGYSELGFDKSSEAFTYKKSSEPNGSQDYSLIRRFELQKVNHDIEITDSTKGVILTSPNGTKYRITINDAGDFVKTAL